MNTTAREMRGNLRAALDCVRQATQSLPQEMEEIYDDLKWVEESLLAALVEREETFAVERETKELEELFEC